jgi:hypothetical protein
MGAPSYLKRILLVKGDTTFVLKITDVVAIYKKGRLTIALDKFLVERICEQEFTYISRSINPSLLFFLRSDALLIRSSIKSPIFTPNENLFSGN